MKTSRRRIALLAAAVGIWWIPAAPIAQSFPAIPTTQSTPNQTPAASPVIGTGLIAGIVTESAQAPISHAIVTLSGGLIQAGSFSTSAAPGTIPGGPRRTLTNGDGRFIFPDLPKGAYSLEVSKPGYSPGAFGRQRPGGVAQSIELGEGERKGPLRLVIWKHASITGMLIDDAGEPFVGATVWSLKRSYALGRSQFMDGPAGTTDDRGIYRIAGLTPGEHILSVVAATSTIPAAVHDAYAQARLDGTMTDYQRQFNTSVIGFTFSLGSPGIRMGDAIMQPVGPYSQGMVPPGPDERSRVLAFQTTFYPATTDIARAEVLTLRPGEERTGVDIHLHLVPTAPVTGRVIGPTGPMSGIGVRLAPAFSPELGAEQSFEAATAITDARGDFTFLGVPAGDYTLRALKIPPAPPPTPLPPGTPPPPTPPPPPPLPKEPTLWANMPITVGADGVAGIEVRLNTGFRVSARFHFGGALPKPPPNIVQTLTMTLQPIDGHPIGYSTVLRGRTAPDGSVTTYEVPPGKYVVRMTAPSASWQALSGWSYQSSQLDGRDVGATPLDIDADIGGLVIVMTDRPSEIAGSVRDERGRVDPTAAVLIFSADAADWSMFGETPRRLRYLRPNVDGVYRMSGLPGGAYLIAAIPDADADGWQNPRVLRELSRLATRVTLADGAKRTLDLVTRPLR